MSGAWHEGHIMAGYLNDACPSCQGEARRSLRGGTDPQLARVLAGAVTGEGGLRAALEKVLDYFEEACEYIAENPSEDDRLTAYMRRIDEARAALAAPAPDTLDAAWKDAEAALPSRYQIERLETEDGHDWHADAIGPDDGWFRGYGPTPIEALRNLTERLRGLDTEAGERGAGG